MIPSRPFSFLLALSLVAGGVFAQEPAGPRMLADEVITAVPPANNNTSPTWAAGAPMLIRRDGAVWASIARQDPGAEPYCNTHWELWRRPDGGAWEQMQRGDAASEREPCPIFLPDKDTIAVSIHPQLLARERDSSGKVTAYCQPALVRFDRAAAPGSRPRLTRPPFDPGAEFSEHSYRAVGSDPAAGAVFLMVMDRENEYHAAWRGREGDWRPVSLPRFPVRACYANVAVRGTAGHVFAIGDIREPVPAWREEKTRVLKRDWDYVFRRVFYTGTPDLANQPLPAPLEVDSVEETAGWMFNLDLHVDVAGRAHLLWVRRNIQYGFLRDRFFPGQPIVDEIRHAVIEAGRVIRSTTILRSEAGPGEPGALPSGRLHALPDGRIFAVLVQPAGAAPKADAELWLHELPTGSVTASAPMRVSLERSMKAGTFFTNTPRGGSLPDHNLHILAAENRDGVVDLRHIHLHVP